MGVSNPQSILDRYVMGTRLRIRKVESGEETVFKLGQKVRSDPSSPEYVSLTNIYVSAAEYEVLSVLPAAELRKTRWTATFDGQRVAVDAFEGPLAGLVLAEVELAEDQSRWPLLAGTLLDVTDDDRFSGGSLALLDTSAASRLLSEVQDK